MPATKATPFRFTPDELAAMDDLAQRRGCKSRVALLRALVAEAADGDALDERRKTARANQPPRPPVSASVARSQSGGYSDPKDCPHPIGRRIGKACMACGKDPA